MLTHFAKFRSLPIVEKMLFTEAVFFLFLSKLVLITLPVKIVLKLSSLHTGTDKTLDRDMLYMIGRALERANNLAIWKNQCLVQSIAGRWMLTRRRIESKINFGVTKNASDEIVAHAWLNAGDYEIVSRLGHFKIGEF